MTTKITDQENNLALVADDDEISLVLIRRLVEQLGLEVITARDGAAALKKFSDQQPAIVITDIEMPGMDGLTASEQMRELDGLGDVPIIVISGVDDRSVIKRAHEIGIHSFLKKPISLADLRTAVSSALPGADLRI